ncbi:MAG: hypothetical protein ACRDVP_05640 [Acidimicrobiales bacterium]
MSDRSVPRRAARTFLRATLSRPTLWTTALGTIRRLAAPGWWRRPPFLPLPDPSYWRFRMQTAYGDDWSGRPTTQDVIDYLRWCQRVKPPRR